MQVGSADGLIVGHCEGESEGLELGFCDGKAIGTRVGLGVGYADGENEGFGLGAGEGCRVDNVTVVVNVDCTADVAFVIAFPFGTDILSLYKNVEVDPGHASTEFSIEVLAAKATSFSFSYIDG